MKKVILTMMLFSFLVLMGSCQLAKEDAILTPIDQDDKHLVGLYVQIIDNESPTDRNLLPEYGEEEAVYIMNGMIYNNGTSTTVFDDSSYGFIDVNNHIKINDNVLNGITTRTITQEISASLYFSPEINDKIVDFSPIYEGEDMPSLGGSAYMMGYGQSIQTYFNDEYEKDGVLYIVKFTINMNIFDELTEVNLIEMSNTHEMIKTTTFNEPIATYETQDTTAYVIIEEIYQNNQDEFYTKRTIYDRGTNPSIPLRFFVHPLLIMDNQKVVITFKS